MAISRWFRRRIGERCGEYDHRVRASLGDWYRIDCHAGHRAMRTQTNSKLDCRKVFQICRRQGAHSIRRVGQTRLGGRAHAMPGYRRVPCWGCVVILGRFRAHLFVSSRHEAGNAARVVRGRVLGNANGTWRISSLVAKRPKVILGGCTERHFVQLGLARGVSGHERILWGNLRVLRFDV